MDYKRAWPSKKSNFNIECWALNVKRHVVYYLPDMIITKVHGL
jgi:hypothetical protein